MNQGSWSGITYHMFRTLSLDYNIEWAGPVIFPKWAGYIYRAWSQLNRLLNRKFTSHNFLYAFFSSLSVWKKLRNNDYDFIVIGAGEPELFAFLRTNIPVIYIADTTFDLMVDYYPWHKGLYHKALRQGHLIEKKAIDRAFHLIYSSAWAANSALFDFGATASKLTIAPFGPSLLRIPTEEEIRTRQITSRCKLLFMGTNWERKGGDIVCQAYKQLRESGFDCHLVIVGCLPPFETGGDCEVYPNLDKNDPVDSETLYNIFSGTDILISPSRADCTPVTFSEAAAFGIPVITSVTGGIPDIVVNGKNGFCLPYDAAPERYSASIRELWKDKENFLSLRLKSRKEYELRLNWNNWRKQFSEAIKTLNKC
jgi:glycosyltransferase involved in cell wall biosynthesis